ncbi:hypothetical protein HYX12_02985 [Candidatus Woesearchaeota archaeon]|nr:hypothetical protein [Candidatus Woesearchaeota archaeon]
MTLDLTVYCKREPNPTDLVHLLSAIDYGERDGAVRLLNCNVGEGQAVEINIHLKPSVMCREYEREPTNKMIAEARARGYDIPESLVKKFDEDGKAWQREFFGRHNLDPRTIPTPPYVVRADKELLTYVSGNPYLRKALPKFSMIFDLVYFSGGVELYPVKLATFIGSDEDRVSSMAVIAMLIAEKYEGILYDHQSDSMGVPDIGRMVRSASDFFEGVVDSLESGEVLDRIIDEMGNERKQDIPPTIH